MNNILMIIFYIITMLYIFCIGMRFGGYNIYNYYDGFEFLKEHHKILILPIVGTLLLVFANLFTNLVQRFYLLVPIVPKIMYIIILVFIVIDIIRYVIVMHNPFENIFISSIDIIWTIFGIFIFRQNIIIVMALFLMHFAVHFFIYDTSYYD